MKCNDAFYVGICPARKKNGECVSTFPCKHKTASLTNAERIRTMSDEELFDFIYGLSMRNIGYKPEKIRAWLQQPAKEDN